jgi:hypothetical protein
LARGKLAVHSLHAHPQSLKPLHHARRLVCLDNCWPNRHRPCHYLGFATFARGQAETSPTKESQPDCLQVGAPQRKIQRQAAQRINGQKDDSNFHCPPTRRT